MLEITCHSSIIIVTTFVLVVKEENTQKYMYAFLSGVLVMDSLSGFWMDYCL